MARAGGTKGAVFGILDKVTDCILLSLIFLLFSVPVFTMGASFTALYYTVNKVHRHSRGYMWSEFVGAFKRNFKQATLTWLIFLAIGVILGGDLWFVTKVMHNSSLSAVLNIFFLLLGIIFLAWCGYVFPYIARFEDTIRVTLKNCALIAVMNFWWSLLVAGILAGVVVGVYLFFPVVIVLPAGGAILLNDVLEPIFRKYMSEEDQALEDERNM